MRLPDFVGLGALKAGTSTLHALLQTHPGLALPTDRKEVMFFDRYWDRGLAWYASHFPEAPGQLLGDISPNYLFDPAVPARMAQVLPEARLLVVLRDPVERAISQYRFYVKEQGFKGDLDAFLDAHDNAVARGRYAEQLSRYLDHFPRERLLVLDFGELARDPATTVQRVAIHLGVDPTFVPPNLGERANASHVPRFHAAYQLARKSARWLYDRDLGLVVQGAKRLGLRRAFTRATPDTQGFQPPSPAALARLADAYAGEREALERLGLPAWSPRAP